MLEHWLHHHGCAEAYINSESNYHVLVSTNFALSSWYFFPISFYYFFRSSEHNICCCSFNMNIRFAFVQLWSKHLIVINQSIIFCCDGIWASKMDFDVSFNLFNGKWTNKILCVQHKHQQNLNSNQCFKVQILWCCS